MAAAKPTKAFIAPNAFDLLGDNDAGDDVIAKLASIKVEPVADVSKPSKTDSKKAEVSKTPVQLNTTNVNQNTANSRVNSAKFPQNHRSPYNYNTNSRPFYPNNNNRYTQPTNNGNTVNNLPNQGQIGQPRPYFNGANSQPGQQRPYFNGGNTQIGQQRPYFNGGNSQTGQQRPYINRRFQNAPQRVNNFVDEVKNEKIVASDETGSVKSVKSDREQEEIQKKLKEEAEQKFREFKYDPLDETKKRDELWKLNKLIDAKEEDLEKIKAFYYKEKDAGQISETTNNNWNRVREEKAALLKKKSEIREYLNMSEQKKMTFADYEKIKEEKKKALEAFKPAQNLRVESQNSDFSGLVVMSKKGDDDSAPKSLSKQKVEVVKTEKTKKLFVPLQVVTIGGEAQNQSRNRNVQNRAVNPPKLDSDQFPSLA